MSKRLSGLSISEQVIRNPMNTVRLIKKPSDWDEERFACIVQTNTEYRSKPIILAANKADLLIF